MESEIDLLRQENARLVAKNYELEAEIVKLRQIVEENARRDVRVEELEQKNTELEARFAILEQSSLVVSEQPQNDKEAIVEVLPEVTVSNVDLSNTVVDQRNNDDAKTSEEKEMIAKDSSSVTSDLTHCEEDLSITSAELVTLPEQVVKESIPACKSVTSSNKSSAGISPVKSSMADKQALALASENTETECQKIPYNQKVEQDLRRELSSTEVGDAYEDRVKDVKSKNGVDDKSARTLVYSEIKPLLPDITDVNLRKITFRAKKIYILFDGIGINRIQIISCSASAISNLSDNQIQDIINDFPPKATNTDDVDYDDSVQFGTDT
ncbi:unnamed protein product [Rhizophagus irregularis]|nr:unnamed protein product [Rhizophagus irregularis]